MTAPQRASGIWIGVLIALGALLAVTLLVQTVVTYQYVSTSLIRQQARRIADEHLRDVERSVRLTRASGPIELEAVLNEVRSDTGSQVAALTILQGDGSLVATSGQPAATLGPDQRTQFLANAAFVRDTREGRDVLIGVFPCRCGVPQRFSAGGDQRGGGRTLIEIVLYRDSLSAPFARLMRNAAISASAALALLVAVVLIGLRVGPYVRGKQLETQADVARQVQRDLLPSHDTWPAGIDVAADCIPASQVGGDFYDITSLPDGGAAFALGDVAGHGLSAALLMGLVHGAMSSPPWGTSGEPPELAAARLNHLLVAKSASNRFASLFWCAYDPASHQLRYVNAGHPPPLRLSRTTGGAVEVDRLTDAGLVLGIVARASYRTVAVDAHPGDLLVIFSDGLVEASNSRGEPFGDARLLAVARTLLDRPSREVADAIFAAVRAFVGGTRIEDDQTLLIVRLWDAPTPAP
jgi:hypothetical protein